MARVPAPSSVRTPASAPGLASPPGIPQGVPLSARCHHDFRHRLPVLRLALICPRRPWILIPSTLPLVGNCWPEHHSSLLLPCSRRMLTPSLLQVPTSNRTTHQAFLWDRGHMSSEAGGARGAPVPAWTSCTGVMRCRRGGSVWAWGQVGPDEDRVPPIAGPASGTLHGCP